MEIKEYIRQLSDLRDMDLQISSITESKHFLTELEELEVILTLINENIVKDMRSIETEHLTMKMAINKKYTPESSPTVLSRIGICGSASHKRAEEMKRLDREFKYKIQEYKNLKDIVNDLLAQILPYKAYAKDFIKQSLNLK